MSATLRTLASASRPALRSSFAPRAATSSIRGMQSSAVRRTTGDSLSSSSSHTSYSLPPKALKDIPVEVYPIVFIVITACVGATVFGIQHTRPKVKDIGLIRTASAMVPIEVERKW